MTEKVKERLEFLLDCGYRKNRADGGKNLTSALSGLHPAMRNTQLFKAAVDAEKPVLYKEDLFGFNRFNRLLPVDDSVYKPYIFEMGNITADYETLLEIGIEGLRKQALSKYEYADEEAKAFYDALFVTFDACADITEKYRVDPVKVMEDVESVYLESCSSAATSTMVHGRSAPHPSANTACCRATTA